MAKPRINPAIDGVAVAATTAWTNTNRRNPAAVYIADGGDLVVTFDGSTDVTFANTVAGSILPISIATIDATNATAVVVLYTDPERS